jgi:hypothetical protein
VTVSVRFYGSENFHVRTDTLANHAMVMRERLEVNFSQVGRPELSTDYADYTDSISNAVNRKS